MVVLAFVITILVGTALLLLPISRTGEEPISPVNALFTSTSAVCVTGLIVLDTGHDFSPFGQAVILLLIQVGGLGIMAFSAIILIAAGRQVGLVEQSMVEETYGKILTIRPASLIRKIALYTFVLEFLGVILLYFCFSRDFGTTEAIWQSVFHSVSAFCNAGFSLFSDSFVRYREDPAVNLVIMFLIVVGGLGFIVVADVLSSVRSALKRRHSRFTLHSRIVLLATGVLILGGALVAGLLEIGNVFHDGPWGTSVLASFFLSVTSRTAGFNTFDTSQLSSATLLFVIVLMIIGASPGSTGGGIKTTTMVVVGALVFTEARNRSTVEIGNRRIPRDIVAKALATVSLFLAGIFLGVALLQVTERSVASLYHLRISFIDYLFEVVSALGTVGLSTGVTPGLTAPGKLVIIACMFVGRLGPLVVAGSLIGQEELPYSYPEERIMVG
jgi:trk system potassium uptake protein TrkH